MHVLVLIVFARTHSKQAFTLLDRDIASLMDQAKCYTRNRCKLILTCNGLVLDHVSRVVELSRTYVLAFWVVGSVGQLKHKEPSLVII